MTTLGVDEDDAGKDVVLEGRVLSDVVEADDDPDPSRF